MIKYKGYIIEGVNYFGCSKYYIYEPKHWNLINTFQNYPLSRVKIYIDKKLKEDNNE